MNKPHKHAALIKAWADGAVIQFRYRDTDAWDEVSSGFLSWSENCQYRVKPAPTVLKYRRYIRKALDGELLISTVNSVSHAYPASIQNNPFFVKWIDCDWIQHIVTD